MKNKLKELKETLEKADQQLQDIRKDTAGLSGVHMDLKILRINLNSIIKELEDEK